MPDRNIEQKKSELHQAVIRALFAARQARETIRADKADPKTDLAGDLSRGLTAGNLVLH